MKFKIYILLSLFIMSCVSQKPNDIEIKNNKVGQPITGDLLPNVLCDTITGEQVSVQWIDGVCTCYEWQAGNWVDRSNCDNLAVCKDAETNCYKSKTLYTVVDNTKTRFNWSMDLLVSFTDGSTEVISQTPQAGWTQQLNHWVDIFDVVLNEKCDAYLIEARCNLTPAGCGGLLPPPSELVGTIPEMQWRYLQISECSTCPAINNVEILSINGNALIKPRPLVMKYVEGEEIRYSLCEECGEEGKLYYFNSNELVAEEDMPLCLFECSESFPPIPEPICKFLVREDGCDDLGDEDNTNDVSIVRICDICDGNIECNYYIENNQSLDDYVLVGDFTDCNGNIIEEPILCDIIDYEPLCYYYEGVSGVLDGYIDNCGNLYDCNFDYISQDVVTDPIKIDCDCDYSSVSFTMCADIPDNAQVQFIRVVDEISGCAEAKRTSTDYNIDGVTPLTIDISNATSTYECIHPSGDIITCRQFLCEYVDPTINTNISTPIKEQIAIADIKIKTLKQKLSRTVSKKKREKLEIKISELRTKYVSAAPISPCIEGEIHIVKFANGNVIEVDGEAATAFDSTGYVGMSCEIDPCPPLSEADPVKVLNEVSIDWSPICDTVVCKVVTQETDTVFAPIGVETNTWILDYNGGTLDTENPLVGCNDFYTPPVNQNVHILFDLNLPECAVINEAKILFDHSGSSGTLYRPYNSSTSAQIPNEFNGGAVTNEWAWHQGSSSSCAAGSGGFRIDGVGFPCLTTRPIRFVSEMTFFPTVDDLNNLAIASWAANANIDTFHSVKLLVDFDLPEGCLLLDEEGNPITENSGTLKGLNSYIIGQKNPIEITGTVTVEEPCNTLSFTEVFCLGADLPDYGLFAGDYIQQIGLSDCEGNILGGSYYTLGLILIDGVDPVIDANCVLPDIIEVQSCVEDMNGDQWQQIVIIIGTQILSSYFLNTATLVTSLNIGEFNPCPIQTTNFTKNKTCALVNDEEIKGYEISYILDGVVESYFEDLEGDVYLDYAEYCCDDCIQYAGCFDPRFVRFTEIVINGQTIDLTAENGGTNMTNSDVVNYLSENYSGSYVSNTIFGSNYTGCTSIDTWEFVFTNGVAVDSISAVAGTNPVSFEFSTIGDCSKECIDLVPCGDVCLKTVQATAVITVKPIKQISIKFIKQLKSSEFSVFNEKEAGTKSETTSIGELTSAQLMCQVNCSGDVIETFVFVNGGLMGSIDSLEGFEVVSCPLPQEALPSYQPTGDPQCFQADNGDYVYCQLYTNENDIDDVINTYTYQADGSSINDTTGLLLQPCAAGTITAVTSTYWDTNCDIAVEVCVTNNALSSTDCDTTINGVVYSGDLIDFSSWSTTEIPCPKEVAAFNACCLYDGEEAYMFIGVNGGLQIRTQSNPSELINGDWSLVTDCACGSAPEVSLLCDEDLADLTVTRPTDTPQTGWANENNETGNLLSDDVEFCYTISSAANAAEMNGLDSDDPDASWNTLDYAVYTYNANGNQLLRVYENGGFVFNAGTWAFGDEICIRRIAGTVTYYQNGTLIYTSGNTSTNDLQVGSSYLFQNFFWNAGVTTLTNQSFCQIDASNLRTRGFSTLADLFVDRADPRLVSLEGLSAKKIQVEVTVIERDKFAETLDIKLKGNKEEKAKQLYKAFNELGYKN